MFVDFLGWPFKKLEGKKERGREGGRERDFSFLLGTYVDMQHKGIFLHVCMYKVCVYVQSFILVNMYLALNALGCMVNLFSCFTELSYHFSQKFFNVRCPATPGTSTTLTAQRALRKEGNKDCKS